MAESAVDARPRPDTREGASFREYMVTFALLAPAMGLLVLFFVYPLSRIALRSLDVSGTYGFAELQLGIGHYHDALFDSAFQIILRNTFIIAAETTVACLILAYPLALLITVVGQQMRRALLTLAILPFWVSVVVRLYGFTQILGRRGLVNSFLVSAGVIDEPLDLLFNRFAAVVGMVHYLLPFMLLVLYAVMSGIDDELIAAARSLGASPRRIFRDIIWPLSASGVYAGGVLVFVLALGFFVTPAVLGGPRETTIAVYIQQRVSILDWGVASAMGMLLLLATVVLLAVFNKLVRVEQILSTSGATSGKGTSVEGAEWASGWLKTTLWIYSIIVLVFLLGPLIVVILVSFSPETFLTFPPTEFSLRWYQDAFGDDRWRSAFSLSAKVAVASMVLATAMGLGVGVALVRRLRQGRAMLRLLVLAPIIVPHILSAAGFLDIANLLGIRRSLIALVAAHTILALPLVTLVCANALQNFDTEIENAAVTLGASRVRAVWTVTLRLILPGLGAAGLLAFVTSWDEVVAALFLATGGRRTLPVEIFGFLGEAIRPTVAAIGTLLIVIVVVLRFGGEALMRRFGVGDT